MKNFMQGFREGCIGKVCCKISVIIILIAAVKLLILMFFSSDYQNKLFVPFVHHYLSYFDNPWQYFYQIQPDKFPYPPIMLYIFSLSFLPYKIFCLNFFLLQNLFFKLPIFLSDIFIFYILVKIFPNKIKEVIIFYFSSIIVTYASYVHSQLDLLPVAFLIFSVYLLINKKLIISAVFFAIAVNTKLHILAALPIMLIFIFKNYKPKFNTTVRFLLIQIIFFLIISCHYFFSPGYIGMVFKNSKQSLVFDAFYPMGNLKIYLVIFSLVLVYVKFLSYKKVNNDLLFAYLGLLFSTFVFFIYPSPGWYVWLTPFLSFFFIANYQKKPTIIYSYIILNLAYLVYFLFFHIFEYQDLNFITVPVTIKINNEILRNTFFTILEAVLFITVFLLYKFGVRSNSVYKKGKNFVIGLGGDSASGKSTVLSDIKFILGERLLEIEGDYDHRWFRDHKNWDVFTHLDPKANYLHRQTQDLIALKLGQKINRGEYNHSSGNFTNPVAIEPKEFIILSGLHPFYLPLTRKIIDLKIFLDTEEKLKHHWKILRDIKLRNYGKEKVLEQIEKRASDARKYIYPQKEFADLIVSYSAQDNFIAGEAKASLSLKLKLVLNSSIRLEALVSQLSLENIEACWDYSEDLKTQFLSISCPPSKDIVIKIAKNIIPNLNELTSDEPLWLDGYRGFVQLICMLVLSEKMLEKSDYGEV